MAVRKLLAILALSALVNGTVHAQAAPVFGATTASHPLRDAIARQHQPLRADPVNARAHSAARHSSTATKATAGFALGFAGMMAGTLTAFAIANAARTPGDGRSAMYAGAIIGGGAGAALGVWLASR